jgi:hypothetical protein
MKITFIGVPGEHHDSVSMYGHTFHLGRALDVTEPLVIRKLKNHPHFAAVDDVTDVAFTELPGDAPEAPQDAPAEVVQPEPAKRKPGRPKGS